MTRGDVKLLRDYVAASSRLFLSSLSSIFLSFFHSFTVSLIRGSAGTSEDSCLPPQSYFSVTIGSLNSDVNRRTPSSAE